MCPYCIERQPIQKISRQDITKQIHRRIRKVVGVGIFLGYGILLNYFPYILGRGLYDIIPVLGGNTVSIYDPRYDLQRFSWQIFLSHPLLGIGWGNETYVSSVFKEGIRDHNFFTGTMAETGILGLLAVLSVFAMVYKLLINSFQLPRKTLPESYLLLLAIAFTLFCVLDLIFHGTLGLSNKTWFIIMTPCVLISTLSLPNNVSAFLRNNASEP